MNTIYTRCSLGGLTAVLLLVLTGCDLFDAPASRPPAQDRVLIVDAFAADTPMDPVDVDSAWVANDSLYLDVGYSGGCAEHDFRLYGMRTLSLITIFPPEGSVLLSHDSNGDRCEAYVTEQISFGITLLLDAWGQDHDGPVNAMLQTDVSQAAVRTVEVTVP
ncbi:MAG: hypothetical protein AAGJ10_07915 [Bacteroidota bacterium]